MEWSMLIALAHLVVSLASLGLIAHVWVRLEVRQTTQVALVQNFTAADIQRERRK